MDSTCACHTAWATVTQMYKVTCSRCPHTEEHTTPEAAGEAASVHSREHVAADYPPPASPSILDT